MNTTHHNSCLRSLSNERPAWTLIDTIIIHSMSAPGAEDPHALNACVDTLRDAEVSSHYLIARDGVRLNLVPEARRAWHAGESCLRKDDAPVSGVNDFSLGIELICKEDGSVSDSQYQSLCELVLEIIARHPIRYVYGHEDVALPPGRKTDPGSTFLWQRFKDDLERMYPQSDRLQFPR